jgi:hypothetical protein
MKMATRQRFFFHNFAQYGIIRREPSPLRLFQKNSHPKIPMIEIIV